MAVENVEESKGRVTVFSISGCPHCKAAKTLLKKKGAHYVEINLDVYPERRAEVQERSKKTSAPQIFFNDEYVGGNDALQALEAAGTLDAKLKWVSETPAPPSAPAPPAAKEGAGEGEVQTLEKRDEYADLMGRLKQAVKVSDHFVFPQIHKNCFKGAEAITFLATDQKISQTEAATLAQKLLDKHFFRSVTGDSSKVEGSGLYRFLEDRMALMKHRCLNFTGKIDAVEPPPATEVADQLRRLILAIYDEFLSDDGRGVDYKGIATAESFRRYKVKAETLQRVNLTSLSREEKLAFFINIYNALVIHATVDAGSGPESALQRKVFFTDYTYLIGGLTFSLSEMENGVLRANRRPPYALSKPFGANDERAKVALKEHEPLIHFALVCGAKSCPPIKTYKPEGVDEALRTAARSFFEAGGIVVDVEAKSVTLSKILYWYHGDFGSSDEEMLKWISEVMEEGEKAKLLDLLAKGSVKVAYMPYDWSANSKH